MSRSRRLAAIMFTDIQGYTALMQEDEQKAVLARDKHRRIFNSITAKYRGQVLQYYGDGTLSIFDSAIDAVRCGIEMQLGFREEPVIPVRIGIHTGDIFFNEEEIIGDSVNVASRIESLAVAGSVFVSGKVYDEIKNQASIKTHRLKAFHLKNIEKPIEVYAIANEGLVVPDPETLSAKTGPAPENEADQPKAPIADGAGLVGMTFLATKFFVPAPRPKAVQRNRLTEQLQQGLHRKLTLISAPAGFGKSSLVSEWIAGAQRRAAWLSLEEKDSDLNRFLAYFIAALQKLSPLLGQGPLGLIQSLQPPPAESVLTMLLNEIAAAPEPLVLVLDDYHLVDHPAVDQALGFLLDHQPPQLHLIITTREDPNLPLARLRVRGQMTELRAADLRFTASETAEFLRQSMGLDLSETDISTLEDRTEGWIAGLQMAALSMQGRGDAGAFIRAFAGSHHFILDYLMEEVLQRQNEAVRNFLLQTAVLDRLCGPLCNALTGREDGSEVLETLDRENLFVVPLDDRRRWFRYHHLFADVLQAHAAERQPGSLPDLHRRASRWYQDNGFTGEAVQHALAARDFERTAELIEPAWPKMDGNYQSGIWLGWVKQLPEELLRNRPVLLTNYAWALLNAGAMEAGGLKLQEAERCLETTTAEDSGKKSPAPVVFVDEVQFRFLPASLATAKCYHALALGDIPATRQHARRALGFLPENDYLRRGPAASLLGLACWADGDLEEAFQALDEAMRDFQKAGSLTFAISGAYGLADIRLSQGRLQEAVRVYERALRLVQENSQAYLRGTADIYLGLGDLKREQGELEAAAALLQKSEQLGEQFALPDWPCRLALAHARLMEARGDPDAALEYLDKAERLYFATPVPQVRPIAALKARLHLRQGRIAEARVWAQQQKPAVDAPLHFLREFEHLTLARLLLTRHYMDHSGGHLSEATGLLSRLLIAAEQGGRAGSLIEILLLQALTHEAAGDAAMALSSLERALHLAEPEGYVRIFLDEGPAMGKLLSEALAQGILPAYVSRLLGNSRFATASHHQHIPAAPAARSLIEPLSQRELEILQLIAQGFSNQEISKRLFLALSTIKGHNQHIFGKLGVQRRTEAIARARELDLLK